MRSSVVATVLAASFVLSACNSSEKVWIVVDLEMPDGTEAQMAFDNPSAPDMTLAECEASIDDAVPTLMQGIQSAPEARDARFVSASCIQSDVDPIEPS